MASLNPLTQELVFKIVFYGPGLGGKTTTLQHIHGATKPENRGKLVSLATPTDRTLYFDYLPIQLAKIGKHVVRLQLFTVPGQVYYAATRKLVLTGADGVVFVADSQTDRAEANQESLDDLVANLVDHGRTLSTMPHTFHWNKRDIEKVTPAGEMDRRYNLYGAPSRGTVATTGVGVFAGLEDVTRLVVEAYRAAVPTNTSGNEAPERVVIDDDASIAGAIQELTHRKKSSIPAAKRKTAINMTAPPSNNPDGFSLSVLWADDERASVLQIEHLIAAGDTVGAVLACDVALMRVLASTAGLAGPADAPRDPSLVWLLLGLDGARWLSFRSLVRAARDGAEITQREAVACLLLAAEARRARDRIV